MSDGRDNGNVDYMSNDNGIITIAAVKLMVMVKLVTNRLEY